MHILLTFLLLLLAGVVFASDHLQIPLRDKISSPAPENFDIYESDASPYHSIRIKRQNSTLCDTPADQYTGWLDIGHKHIFFWYFAPERDDASGENALTLWLAGGPGVPSLVSMLQELGPCLINEYGNGTVYNPHGWNKNTALLFVDQPAGVGFSYVDDGEQVPGDSFTSASDMYAFLKLFTSQAFPKHKDAPLIITGESYAVRTSSLPEFLGNFLLSLSLI
jgi:cathepsin A (carboxypeptidase C)